MTDLHAHHAGTTVADLERAVTFYRDVLGLEVLDRFSVAGEAFSTGVDVPNASAQFAHLAADGIRVELVAYDSDADPCAVDGLDQPGATHLGFAVDDVDAFYDGLPADVETVSEPQTTASGTRILFLHDPEGNSIEVLES